MISYDIHEARAHFSEILARVESGAVVYITRAGEPFARILPAPSAPGAPARGRRCSGTERDRIRIAADFEAPLPADLLRAWEERA